MSSGSPAATVLPAGRQAPAPDPVPRKNYPGCIVIYIFLYAIGAGVLALGGIVFLLALPFLAEMKMIGAGLVTELVICGMAAFYYLLFRALMAQKNWARIAVIVINALGIPSNLLSIVVGLLLVPSETGYDPSALICVSVVSLAISGYLIYWFAANGKYFESSSSP